MTFAQAFRTTLRELTGTLTGVLPGSRGFDLLNGVWPGAAGAAPLPGTRERLNAYGTSPWVHAVADKVASSFASVEWRLFVVRRQGTGPALPAKLIQRAGHLERTKLLTDAENAGDLVRLDSHVLLDALDHANPYQTGVAMRKLWLLHWDLAGDAFLLKERNGAGAPVALWPIPPSWIMWTPTPSRRTFRVSFKGWQGEIPDTEFLWISNPDPQNPYGRGVGMAQALADEIETDEYAAKASRQTFLNGARPDFMIYPKESENRPPWSDDAVNRLRADWMAEHQGFWRTAKPRFSTREIGVYEFEQTNLRNLQMVPIRQFERDTIAQTWGIPPEMLGILENSNRATISGAAYHFSRYVLVPRLEAFRAALQERLVPEYDPRLIVDYASPVEDDAALGLEAAKAAPWALTTNQWLALAGQPRRDDPTGELHAIPTNVRMAALDEPPPPPAPSPFAAPSPQPPPPKDFSRLTTDELLDLRRLVGKVEG